jgi:DNA-binding response OmpR family regulator
LPDSSAYAQGIASIAAGSRAVELLPEGTGRLGTLTSIGPRTAVVIDATSTTRNLVTRLLDVHGFSVDPFDNLAEAAERCAATTPDVVVMEPHDRDVDALDVLRAWHERVAPAQAPVVWCSTVTPTQRHLEAGAELSLRGVVIKPFSLEAMAALVVRVVRTHERELALLDAGVDLRRLVGPLPSTGTAAWLRIESRLADEHVRPLSMVVVGAAAREVLAAVRSVIRSVDLLALLDVRTSAVLLPDVPPSGAEIVARRIAGALGDMEPAPDVCALTRVAGESGEALLERALQR